MICAAHLLIALTAVALVFAILWASPCPNPLGAVMIVGPLQNLAHIVAQIALT